MGFKHILTPKSFLKSKDSSYSDIEGIVCTTSIEMLNPTLHKKSKNTKTCRIYNTIDKNGESNHVVYVYKASENTSIVNNSHLEALS